MVLELPVLIPLVFYLICLVPLGSSLNPFSCSWFRCSFFWLWINIWFMALIPLALHSFWLWFAFSRRLSKSCCSLDVFILTSFLLYLLHILYLVQLSHTCSDFSHLLKVMILETRILHHLIQVLLSSPLMKQLTCHVDNISLIHIFGLDI